MAYNFFINEIKKIFPYINSNDENWLILDEETFSIEFNVGEDDPINNIMLHVRGEDEALKAIGLVCKKINLQAFDTTESKIIDFDKETNEGFTQWREYKNNVLNKYNMRALKRKIQREQYGLHRERYVPFALDIIVKK
ncbi:MAG: hypothetical protein LBG90_08090 [Spirochaetaceae bacterium]|jgi:hypothetical protein|nr:hypothetical protein [Spirochaetaceae bacterium]